MSDASSNSHFAADSTTNTVKHWDQLPLEPRHVSHLQDAGISEDVAAARGYKTLPTQSSIKRYGFSETQARTAPGLLIPMWNPDGGLLCYKLRPDSPRIGDKGKPLK